jgi:hypothetical protein
MSTILAQPQTVFLAALESCHQLVVLCPHDGLPNRVCIAAQGIVVYTTRFPDPKLSGEGCNGQAPPLYGGDRGCIVAEIFGGQLGY